MIILDTNVLSAVMAPIPDLAVLNWLNIQPSKSVWTSAITLMELRYGVNIMPIGRRRQTLADGLESVLENEIEGRIVPFDAAAAEAAAGLMALRKTKGRPGELRDTMIAGIALATRATVATRNTSHFEDLSVTVVNPWTA